MNILLSKIFNNMMFFFQNIFRNNVNPPPLKKLTLLPLKIFCECPRLPPEQHHNHHSRKQTEKQTNRQSKLVQLTDIRTNTQKYGRMDRNMDIWTEIWTYGQKYEIKTI